jgi:hypothetical protein
MQCIRALCPVRRICLPDNLSGKMRSSCNGCDGALKIVVTGERKDEVASQTSLTCQSEYHHLTVAHCIPHGHSLREICPTKR